MTKFKQFHLKNEMLGANFLANFVGVFLVNGLLIIAEGMSPRTVWNHPVAFWVDALFTPFAFAFVSVANLLYEKPIRHCLNEIFTKKSASRSLMNVARRRLLNEPFVLIALDLSMWLLAAVIYPAIHWTYGGGSNMVQRSLYLNLSTGLITITIAFFLLEHILQKKLAPLFFPHGGLTAIPRTMRIRIRTRLVALLFACNVIPLISIILITMRVGGLHQDAATTLQQLRTSLYINAFVFLAVGIYLTDLVSRNLTIPFTEIIDTLQGVRNGRFDKKVQVTSNDEIGYTGDVINEMTVGLKERERMQKSLDFAMEVQQNLLPRNAPRIEGLDISGTSLYCEETGGDYFDYLMTADNAQKKICVVVGDVADHGIPSALLMTTARAFLRQRTSSSGELDQVITDVNRQIARDVEDSGRFMTLFICEIDRRNQVIDWVNAGHDPAMIYDSQNGEFDELGGNGLPLGVSDKTAYQKFDRAIQPGQMILIGTDGIWEAQNREGEMFGKQRFKDVIRRHADQPAEKIIQAVISQLDKFRYPLEKTDDVTLVVAKIT
jgi:sigma-B regulation protein RsbU (phosphoserine phosphatase)